MLEPTVIAAPSKTSSNCSFGLVFAGVFALAALYPALHGLPVRTWALVAAPGFFVVALLRPALLAPLNRQWTKLGAVMHKIMAPLIMGVVFVAVFVPMGLAMRLLGKRPLALRYTPQPSYWIARTPRPADFFNHPF